MAAIKASLNLTKPKHLTNHCHKITDGQSALWPVKRHSEHFSLSSIEELEMLQAWLTNEFALGELFGDSERCVTCQCIWSGLSPYWNDSALGLQESGKCLGTIGTMWGVIFLFLLFSYLTFQDRLCYVAVFSHRWAWISPLQTLGMFFIFIVTTKTEQSSIRGGQTGQV